jgi:hypothetical protein
MQICVSRRRPDVHAAQAKTSKVEGSKDDIFGSQVGFHTHRHAAGVKSCGRQELESI